VTITIMTSFRSQKFTGIQQAGGMSGYVSLGPFVNFQDADADRCFVTADGEIGHNTASVITHLTILRNGVPLHPAGCTGLAAPRSKTPDAIEKFSLSIEDVLPVELCGTLVRYEVAWHTLAGTVFLGRRPSDLIMNTPLTITLMGLRDVAAV
jgi:hypothetical protein